MRRIASLFAAILAASALSVSSASARTTVFTDSSNFTQWADAVNAQNTDGGADGLTGFIPNGGWIAFQNPSTHVFDEVRTQIVLSDVTGAGTARFYVGQTNNNGFFSALNFININLTTGVNEVTSTVLSDYCVSIGGCNAVIFQPIAGTTLSVDRVLARNPEPGAWSLMVFGFGGIAWRMKASRKKDVSASNLVLA